jgi:hypothetical protein
MMRGRWVGRKLTEEQAEFDNLRSDDDFDTQWGYNDHIIL